MTQYQAMPGQTGDSTQPKRGNGLAVASLVVGICSLLFGVIDIVLGPLALVFGIIGLQRANRGAKGRGLAIAGIVLGAIGTLFGILAIVALAANGGSFSYHVG